MGGTRSLQAGQRPVIAWWSLVVLNIVLFAVDVPLGFAARWAGQSYSLQLAAFIAVLSGAAVCMAALAFSAVAGTLGPQGSPSPAADPAE